MKRQRCARISELNLSRSEQEHSKSTSIFWKADLELGDISPLSRAASRFYIYIEEKWWEWREKRRGKKKRISSINYLIMVVFKIEDMNNTLIELQIKHHQATKVPMLFFMQAGFTLHD